MAFASKYITEFQDWNGDTIKVDIQEDGFTGTVESFTAVGGTPATIEHQCNVNVKESYILPSKATIRFYVNNPWDCHELLYSTDRQHKVRITINAVQQFIGWVIAGIQTEEYATGRYIIQLKAIDGLADLKNIPYLNSGALYNQYRTPLQIIDDIIGKIELSTYAIYENIDIFSDDMATAAASDSPLNQCYIHTDAYGRRIDEVFSCYEVLEKIMQFFHCRFFQSETI